MDQQGDFTRNVGQSTADIILEQRDASWNLRVGEKGRPIGEVRSVINQKISISKGCGSRLSLRLNLLNS